MAELNKHNQSSKAETDCQPTKRTKQFNLFTYVYGRLYQEQYFRKNAEGLIIEDTSKIYSWKGILCWLKKEGYIFGFKIANLNEQKSVLVYKFNRQQLTCQRYVKGIERNLKRNSINIIPMGELIEQKKYDEFEAQYKMPVEYIERADRCLADLNKQILEELEKQTSNKQAKEQPDVKAEKRLEVKAA